MMNVLLRGYWWLCLVNIYCPNVWFLKSWTIYLLWLKYTVPVCIRSHITFISFVMCFRMASNYYFLLFKGIIERDQIVFQKVRTRGIPIIMVTSGGYLKTTARIIADSILNLKSLSLITCDEAENAPLSGNLVPKDWSSC